MYFKTQHQQGVSKFIFYYIKINYVKLACLFTFVNYILYNHDK